MSDALSVKIREKTGKSAARELRRNDEIPAVLYGLKDNLSLSVSSKEFAKVLDDKGRSALIDLKVEGGKQRKVILKETQTHPLKELYVHVDFLEVALDKAVKVSVPVNLVGQSPGEKQGGIVNHILKTLEAECLPINIPQVFDVDMSGVELGQVVHVSDMQLPEGVKVLQRPTEPVASVHLAKVEEEKPAEGEEEAVEGEVEGEEKDGDAAAEEKAPKKEESTQKEG
ncbi:MAG: 50S ribosomal protein L25 [Nitrospinaceae bacterium]|nr:50S ribosomal protein L25 [Nitrospinaceae bacterium]